MAISMPRCRRWLISRPTASACIRSWLRSTASTFSSAAGLCAKAKAAIVNAAQLVTPKGSIGVQEKLIMTPFETDWGISAGKQARVFDTALGMIGINICYDSEFPLLARAMAEAGAELLLVPSCTERVSGYHRVRTGARARALENQIAAIVSPTVGDALWSPAVDRNSGAAGIYVPSEQTVSDTGILAQGEINAAQWVTARHRPRPPAPPATSGEMRNLHRLAQPAGCGPETRPTASSRS